MLREVDGGRSKLRSNRSKIFYLTFAVFVTSNLQLSSMLNLKLMRVNVLELFSTSLSTISFTTILDLEEKSDNIAKYVVVELNTAS